MLTADMVVTEQPGLLHPILDDLLDTRAKRNLSKRHRRAATRQIPFDFKPNLLR